MVGPQLAKIAGLEELWRWTLVLSHPNLLTNLPGVERGLAHGFVDVAGGDGDTVGHTHRILAGIALQGHSWERGSRRTVNRPRYSKTPETACG